MVAVVWVPVVAQVVVSRGFVAVAATVVDDDVALAVGGLGHERRGWGVSRGAIDRFGVVCRHFRGAGGCFSAGGRVVVAVDDSVDAVDGVVDIADGGCVGIISSGVAMLGGLGGPVTRAVGSVSVWAVGSAGFVVA